VHSDASVGPKESSSTSSFSSGKLQEFAKIEDPTGDFIYLKELATKELTVDEVRRQKPKLKIKASATPGKAMKVISKLIPSKEFLIQLKVQ